MALLTPNQVSHRWMKQEFVFADKEVLAFWKNRCISLLCIKTEFANWYQCIQLSAAKVFLRGIVLTVKLANDQCSTSHLTSIELLHCVRIKRTTRAVVWLLAYLLKDVVSWTGSMRYSRARSPRHSYEQCPVNQGSCTLSVLLPHHPIHARSLHHIQQHNVLQQAEYQRTYAKPNAENNRHSYGSNRAQHSTSLGVAQAQNGTRSK